MGMRLKTAPFFALSMMCVGIQAYSINMENYRILWIGYSLLLYYCCKTKTEEYNAAAGERRLNCGA